MPAIVKAWYVSIFDEKNSLVLVKRFPYMNDVYVKTAYLEEAEYILLEVMDCCLIVYQPYRPLLQIINVNFFNINIISLIFHLRTCEQHKSEM